ncbi:3D (Asp-Asp-Asp) domain-containing protein, partial [Geosporobacter subterraneus DSM 17957]
ELDRVEPEMGAVIAPYDTIKVIRIEEKLVSEKVAIPYQSIIKHNDSLDKGKANIIQKGKNGEKQVEYLVVYENGEVVSKILKEEKILVAAENEVIEKGTAQYLATSRGSVRFRKVIQMTSTAYDAGFESTGKRPGDKYYGLTRSGTKVRPGVVAVDPKVIPLGTKLYIKSLDSRWPDYGFAIAEDTGGAIKGNKVDLYFEDSQDVKKYGRRKVEVYVLE